MDVMLILATIVNYAFLKRKTEIKNPFCALLLLRCGSVIAIVVIMEARGQGCPSICAEFSASLFAVSWLSYRVSLRFHKKTHSSYFPHGKR